MTALYHSASIFSFSHNVFYPIEDKFLLAYFYLIYLPSANAFNLKESKILSFGKELRYSIRICLKGYCLKGYRVTGRDCIIVCYIESHYQWLLKVEQHYFVLW